MILACRRHTFYRIKHIPLQQMETAEDLTVCYFAVLGWRQVMKRGNSKHGEKDISTVSGFNLVKDVFHILVLGVRTTHRGFFADGIKETLFFGPNGILIVEINARIYYHILWSIVKCVVYVEQEIG